MIDVFLDVETYSEVPLTKTGVYPYAVHESTELLIVCWAVDDGAVIGWVPLKRLPAYFQKNPLPFPVIVQPKCPTVLRDLFTMGKSRRTLWAWNAAFERVVLNGPHAKGLGVPRLSTEDWHCVQSESLNAGLPADLFTASNKLGGTSKLASGSSLIHLLSKPDKRSGKRRTPFSNPEEFHKFYEYCNVDVDAERGVHKLLPPLHPTERKLYTLTQRMNDRGIEVDMVAVDHANKLHKVIQNDLAEKCEALTGGIKPSQRAKLVDWVRENGYDIKDLQAPTLRESQEDESCPEHVKQVLKYRLQHEMKAPTKYAAMQKAVSFESRLRGMFFYHAATTGRWSSRIVQLQNLFRPSPKVDQTAAVEMLALEDPKWLNGFFGVDAMIVLASVVRSVLRAKKGHKLLCLDFSQIEARILAWLAGEISILKIYASNEDVYKHAAKTLYRVDLESVTPSQRFTGKVSELSLGYQGGHRALIKMARNFGMKIAKSRALQIVETWRANRRLTVQFWYAVEAAAIKAVRNPGTKVSPRTGKYKKIDSRITFFTQDKWLCCRLPSGRLIRYFEPRIVDGLKYFGIDTFKRKWMVVDTYGGRLTENIVSGTARDLMARALLMLDDAGYKLVGSVHDEAIAEVSIGDKELNMDNAVKIMGSKPSWTEGLPISVDGFLSARYQKQDAE